MFTIDESIKWTKHSWLYNARQYIMRHHTWSLTASTKSVANYLATSKAQVSAPFLIWTKEDKKIYQMYDTKAVCRHAGESEYEWLKYMNRYSIGIEIMSSDWKTYDDRQLSAAIWLTKVLMKNYWIPAENVIRHKDVTSRKRDVWDQLWNREYKKFSDLQKSLKEFEQQKRLTKKEESYYRAALSIHSKLRNYIPDEKLRKSWNIMNNHIRTVLMKDWMGK